MVTADNFYSMVNRKINEMTDEKMVKRSQTGEKLDRSTIERECEEVYFKELGRELEKELNNYNSFFDYVSHDQEAFNKIKNIVSKRLTSVDELLKATIQKPEKKLINELEQTGRQAFDQGDFNKAFHYFSYLALIEPKNPKFWLLKAMSAHNLDKSEDALKAYDYSIALAPDYLLAHIHRLNCLIHAKQLEKAKHCFEDFSHRFDHKEYDNNAFVMSNLEKIKKALA